MEKNLVSVVMGSRSDIKTVQASAMSEVYLRCGIPYEAAVFSATSVACGGLAGAVFQVGELSPRPLFSFAQNRKFC